jgi:uncharacterized protein
MHPSQAVAGKGMETCDVWELARRRAAVQGEIALSDASRLAAQLIDTQGALHYRLSGMIDERGRAAARLELDGVLRTRCDRCGGAVALPIREHALFYFVADEAELAALPIDDSPEEALLGSHHFDLLALVEDQAILALPISPRHEDCAAAVDAGVGARADGETQRPFGVLAALKKGTG